MANTKKKTQSAQEVKAEVIDKVDKIVEDIQDKEAAENNGATITERHIFYKCKYCNHCFKSYHEMHKHANNCRLNPEIFDRQ